MGISPDKKRLVDSIVEITADKQKGRSGTGGTWTQPDIVILSVTNNKFVSPKRSIELITFEVKIKGSISVTGVFEALSHRELAHRSCVIYYCSEAEFEQANAKEDGRILEFAQRNGVGVIVIDSDEERESSDRFIVRTQAEYRTPRSEVLDYFVDKAFKEYHGRIGGGLGEP